MLRGSRHDVLKHRIEQRRSTAINRQPAQRLFNKGLRADRARGEYSPCIDAIGREVAGPEWDGHRECCALPNAALRDNLAAVLTDQLLDQRQTDASALIGATMLALDAVKPLKNARQLCLGNSNA